MMRTLICLLKFMNKADKESPNPNRPLWAANYNPYVIPNRWNLTPKEQLTLDHYVRDEDILKVLSQVMLVPPDGSFAKENKELSEMIFSKPYSAIARSLGYE